MSDAVDYITILRCRKPGARATKTHTWQPDRQGWATTSYDAGASFSCHPARVDGIQSVGAEIEALRMRPDSLVIRGAVKEGRDASNVRRKYAGRDDPFEDVPRRWLMADIDGWPIPDGLDLIEDTVAIIERAIADLLPEPFHDCAAFWQLSSSAGFKPSSVLRVHVWFWLDRCVETAPLRAWVGASCGALVDRALINAVQIHYTADPVVIGRPDPIPHRTGWIEGERDFATLPDLSAAVANGKAFRAAGNGMSASQAETVEGFLAEMGDNDDGGLRGFHSPIRDAVWRYATITPPWERDAEALKARVRAAIEAAPKKPGRDSDVANYLSDAYLDGNIRGAFLKMPTAGGWEACTPEHSLPTESVEDARKRLAESITAFLGKTHNTRLTGSVPRRGLVISEVGLGKTEQALRAIAKYIAAAKAEGRPHRVAYAIPEHILGTEVMRRAVGFGIHAATWRGRGYEFDGVPMCADTEAVELAEQVGLSAGAAVCGNPKNGQGMCPHFRVCLYQQQRQPASAADLVVIAHNHLFRSLPAEVREDLGLVVIDESFWQSALRARDITLQTFAGDAIAHPVLTLDGLKRQVTDEPATNDLHVIRAKVVAALDGAPDGYLSRDHVAASGITPEDCALAKKLEWRRLRDVEMWPGMPKKARKDAHDVATINKQIPRMAAFWNALGDLLSGEDTVTGRIELLVRSDKRGDVRVALINERREFCKDALAQPMLLLDGTGNIAIVREFLPDAEVIAEARPTAPYMTVRQVVGPLSKTSLELLISVES